MEAWEDYQQRAEACRQHAAECKDGVDKENWLKLADQWMRLALSALAQASRDQLGSVEAPQLTCPEAAAAHVERTAPARRQ
jgi:hypothetical protein